MSSGLCWLWNSDCLKFSPLLCSVASNRRSSPCPLYCTCPWGWMTSIQYCLHNGSDLAICRGSSMTAVCVQREKGNNMAVFEPIFIKDWMDVPMNIHTIIVAFHGYQTIAIMETVLASYQIITTAIECGHNHWDGMASISSSRSDWMAWHGEKHGKTLHSLIVSSSL